MTEESASPQKIDINDLSLTAEPLEVDPKADAFQLPPPAPAGLYYAKAKLGSQGFIRGVTKRTNRSYVMGALELRLNAPGQRFDGNPVFDRASTYVTEGNKTCRIAGILLVNGIMVPSQTTDLDLARTLNAFLSGEPTVYFEGDWDGYCGTCEKTVIRGMKRFPQSADGTHKHVTKCKTCGSNVSAQLSVSRYLPVPAA